MNEWFKFYGKNNVWTNRAMRKLHELQQLTEQQLLEKYNDAFIHLFKHAITRSPFYKKLYANHGIGINSIKNIEDIVRLPLIDKRMIRDEVNQIYNNWSFFKVSGLTSGTTGTPLQLYRTIFDISTEQAYIRNYRAMHGYRLGQPLLSIRGTLGKGSSHEYYKKANILYISSPNINASTIHEYYSMICSFKPVAVEAYPSYLHKISMELKNAGLSLTIPVAFTSSETLLDYQRSLAESVLHTKIMDWYGNAERTILLAQNKQLEYEPLPLYSLNEYHDDHIITTGLINKSFPLIRYRVDDKISINRKGLLKDFISPEITQIEGRASDTIDLKDGSVVGCIDHAFKGISNLFAAQVHQYDINKPIIVKLVIDKYFGNNEKEQLTKNFIRLFGENNPFEMVICKMEELTFSKSNKFNIIIKKDPQVD